MFEVSLIQLPDGKATIDFKNQLSQRYKLFYVFTKTFMAECCWTGSSIDAWRKRFWDAILVYYYNYQKDVYALQ